MKYYTLIWVGDERDPVRRFQISEIKIKRAIQAAVVVVLILVAASWDYYRARVDNAELGELRVLTAEQSAEMEKVRSAVGKMSSEMARLHELERKVRIIANLPGASAVGGADVTDHVPQDAGNRVGENDLQTPAGVPIGAAGGPERDPLSSFVPESSDGSQVFAMQQAGRFAGELASGAAQQASSLEELVGQLETKSKKLAASPSIWPTRGWLTSRFGARISPFTGRRQYHGGIDIAAAHGTGIISPARGRVVFVGRKGPLGNTLVIEHGFGVRTLYGHTDDIHVKIGQQVDRGQTIASVGTTGRSTGPHLHYTVEVNGKSRNPLDYIFD